MERVELGKGITAWTLSYFDRKNDQHIIAQFTDGPLQNRLMVQAAREVVKAKLLDFYVVEADEEAVAKLRKNVPDMEEATIAVGSVVKLRDTVQNHTCPEGREDNDTATVRSIGPGGELSLDRDLHGCLYWNIEDVKVAV